MIKGKKKNENFIKPKFSRKLAISAGVSALAAAIAGVGLWQNLQPIPAYARESFSGIKKVVESYDEENPFVILDIVPGTATYTYTYIDTNMVAEAPSTPNGSGGGAIPTETPTPTPEREKKIKVDVPLATMPYITSGETPAETALIEAISSSPDCFLDYQDRAMFAENLIPAEMNATELNVKYEENYGGVIGTEELSEKNGWTEVFASSQMDLSEVNGLLYGDYEVGENETGNGEGYNFTQRTLTFRDSSTYGMGGIVYQSAPENGEYYVTFLYAEDATAGYRPVIEAAKSNIRDLDYSQTTGLYQKVDGHYVYVGTIEQILGIAPTATPTAVSTAMPTCSIAPSASPSGTPDITPSATPEGTAAPTTSPDEETEEGEEPTQAPDPTQTPVPTETPDGTEESTSTSETSQVGGQTKAAMNTGVSDGKVLPHKNWILCVGNQEMSSAVPETGSPSPKSSPSLEYFTSPEPSASPEVNTEEDTEDDSETSDDYYVLTFEYVSDLESPEDLYQIDQVNDIEESWEIRPYDAYQIKEEEETSFGGGFGRLQSEEGGFFSGISEPYFYEYVGSGYGKFKLMQLPEDDENGRPIKVINAPVYIRCRNTNDWLKQYVFNSLAGEENEKDDFAVEVKTVKAGDVTQDLIGEADLIYLEDGMAVFQGDFLEGEFERNYIEKDTASDLSVEKGYQIAYRAVNDLLPVIVDYGIIEDTENYADTNYQKLAKVFLKKDLEAYLTEFDTPEKLFGNLEASEHPDKEDNHFNYVNRNIYIINEDIPLAAEDFNESFSSDKVEKGFKEVLSAIQAENSALSEENKISEAISKAKVVQYIINYAVGLISDFRDMRVLELQPTTNETNDLQIRSDSENDYTTLYWKKKDSTLAGQQILRSTKKIDIVIDQKSVDELAGETTDLNNTYQMIFVGLDGQRLNQNNKKTVYNDSDMNGIIYSAKGDLADSEDNRYAAIDLTAEKKKALLDFMKAGYPIVVEDGFFVDRTAKEVNEDAINTKLVDEESQMYAFLKKAISEYEDYIYTISDVHSSSLFPVQVNIRRPKITYQDEDNVSSVQTVSADESGNYQGQIVYKITDDKGDSYFNDVAVRLYFDLNNDGKFTTAEELGLDGYSNDNGSVTIDFNQTNKGIIPWKLEVADTENAYRRDDLRGFFIISQEVITPIRVLQVVAENTDATADLKKAYDADNVLLGYYLRGAEGLAGVHYEIETLTPDELSQKLAVQADYLLNGCDVLVLGFGEEYQLGGAADAVNSYINENRPVVLSSKALSGTCMGLDKRLLGLSDTQTYEQLGKNGNREYYRFDGLKSEMFGAKQNLTVAQNNDGIISHYPYEMTSDDLKIYQAVEAGNYLLDFKQNVVEDNETQENAAADDHAAITAWYCLGSSFGFSDSNAYEISRKDAANNYYAYSKGSIVYVGQDNYPFTYANAGEEDMNRLQGSAECRIFVNALMAAYNAGLKSPKVAIVAGFAPDAPEVESICIPFDQQLLDEGDAQNGLLEDTTDVYFRLNEPNITFRKMVRVSFYYQDDTGSQELSVGGKTVRVNPISTPIWRVENGQLIQLGEEFKPDPGVIYRFKAPVDALRNNLGQTGSQVYVVVESVFTKYGKEQKITGSDNVTLNRAQLFLLE